MAREPRTHEVRVAPAFFEALSSGDKNSEFRQNDRNYQVGDQLLLKEFVAPPALPGVGDGYTGRWLLFTITHVLDQAQFGPVPTGWVILSLRREHPRVLGDCTTGWVPAERVLESALAAGMHDVVVVGWEGPGRANLYLASSCSVSDAMVLLQMGIHDRCTAALRGDLES